MSYMITNDVKRYYDTKKTGYCVAHGCDTKTENGFTYCKHHQELNRERLRKWKEKNPNYQKEYEARMTDSQIQRRRETTREWLRNNPEYFKLYHRKRKRLELIKRLVTQKKHQVLVPIQ